MNIGLGIYLFRTRAPYRAIRKIIQKRCRALRSAHIEVADCHHMVVRAHPTGGRRFFLDSEVSLGSYGGKLSFVSVD